MTGVENHHFVTIKVIPDSEELSVDTKTIMVSLMRNKNIYSVKVPHIINSFFFFLSNHKLTEDGKYIISFLKH